MTEHGEPARAAGRRKPGILALLSLILVVAGGYGINWLGDRGGPAPAIATQDASRSANRIPAGTGTGTATGSDIVEAFRDKRSDVLVEAEGRVEKILPDDREGSRHQRFIVELASGHTVLIAHNIDLAPRAPLVEGETVRFAGEYEWNDRGGVIHWTHHDPQRRRPGGWIEFRGKRYE